MLTVDRLEAGYGALQVLRGVSFSIEEGTIAALLGANGAGKTTTLRALSGSIPSRGRIELDGESLAGMHPARRVELGLAHIPQGRGTFVDFTVEENLLLGAATVGSRKQITGDMDRWYAAFPRLRERRRQNAGTLSGGEQQMLAVARGLMSRPRILMCDEPSLGLAPAMVAELFAIIADLNRREPDAADRAQGLRHGIRRDTVTLVSYIASSVYSLQPAGLENAKGVITSQFIRPIDTSAPDAGADQYLADYQRAQPRFELGDALGHMGYLTGEALVAVLGAMQEPTRGAMMDAARNMNDVSVGMLLPGITLTTKGAEDIYPIESLRLYQFDGEIYQPLGDVVSYEAMTPSL